MLPHCFVCVILVSWYVFDTGIKLLLICPKMSYYLKSRRLDIRTSDSLIFVLNEDTARQYGLYTGDKIHLCWRDICVYGTVDTTSTLVGYDEVGLYEDVWMKYGIPSNDIVSLDVITKSGTIEAIKKKLLGGTLTYDEIYLLMKDIATRKLSAIEMTYFAASSYSPGFTDDEVYYMTKAMAETGDILDFTFLGKKVVDKHSIGGIPSKGVTPILVPILACFDVTIPNTTSRSITAPAGTADVLETLMPVTLGKDEVIEVVKKCGACLVWGGGLDLAPADDVLINIERPLHIESYDKFIVSIMAKKVATGVQYVLLDLPAGEGTKLPKTEDVPLVGDHFKRLGKLFNIKVEIFERHPMGPDGNGVGPILEARDFLRVLERSEKRPMGIEDTAVSMAGKILEMVGIAKPGQGKDMAFEKLQDGSAINKFWQIAEAQGATRRLKSSELVLGDQMLEYNSSVSGKIRIIRNKEVVQLARVLGTPFVKQAGIYFDKLAGDTVERGERLFTLYGTSGRRIELARRFLEKEGEDMIEVK